MNIDFIKPHGVITQLTATALPDFAVLIGPNGAGKSHLLSALSNGSLAISGMTPEEMQHYDAYSFVTPSNRQANRQTSELTRRLVDAFFVSKSGKPSLSDISLKIFDQAVDSFDVSHRLASRDIFVARLRDSIRSTPRRGIFGLDNTDQYTAELRDKVLMPLHFFEEERNTNRSRRGPDQSEYLRLLSAAMRKGNKLPHELTRKDVVDALHYDDNLVSNLLSQIFSAYKIDQYTWAHSQIEAGGASKYAELVRRYEEVSRPPWQVMREVLADMREAAGDYALFDFDFTDPSEQELGIHNFELFTFKTEMTNRTTGATYDPTSLSSGEKILMALCMVSFNQLLGSRPPQLLLMDEVDAMLHPSMVKALIRTIKTLFVSNGIPVLMTSHSPMTVVTLDEGEVFRVSRAGYHVEISPVTKAEAIGELSEGLATVDVGLRIAASGESRITILTEGHNSKHLRRWAELHYPEDVRVFEGLEMHTNDDKLLAYGRLLSKMNLNTHFVIVWDCDAKDKASTLREELVDDASVTPFAFTHRPQNRIARRGIENNYDEWVLEPYSVTVNDSCGNLIKQEFNGKRKTEFANYLSVNGTPEHFTNFKGLNDVISKVLHGMPSGPADPQEHLN